MLLYISGLLAQAVNIIGSDYRKGTSQKGKHVQYGRRRLAENKKFGLYGSHINKSSINYYYTTIIGMYKSRSQL